MQIWHSSTADALPFYIDFLPRHRIFLKDPDGQTLPNSRWNHGRASLSDNHDGGHSRSPLQSSAFGNHDASGIPLAYTALPSMICVLVVFNLFTTRFIRR